MSKNIIKPILYSILGIISGFFIAKIPQMEGVTISPQIPVFDIISLLITVVLAIYVAKILEKDVQNSQVGKQMFLTKIEQNESLLSSLNEYIGQEIILLSKINNILHRYRTIQNTIHSALKNKKKNGEFSSDCESIENEAKELNRLLTMTPIDSSDQSNITIRDGKITYSNNRITEITTCLLRIDNMLFNLKHKINNSL
ncbi:uncharacterized protein BN813_01084 [Bacteroides sp. CAG:927]|nr:uncharacterized protein BN813_01084 [Bacteroides sp. CAG:927]